MVSINDVVKIGEIWWAKRNLAAPKTFAENEWDFGMFYQWGKNTGWSATNPLVNSDGGTVWDSSSQAGFDWENQQVICPTGFRIPTRAEFDSLIAYGSVAETINGVQGRLIGEMFLPFTGSRTGGLGNLSGTTRYWSGNQGGGAQTHAAALNNLVGGLSIGASTARNDAYPLRLIAIEPPSQGGSGLEKTRINKTVYAKKR